MQKLNRWVLKYKIVQEFLLKQRQALRTDSYKIYFSVGTPRHALYFNKRTKILNKTRLTLKIK